MIKTIIFNLIRKKTKSTGENTVILNNRNGFLLIELLVAMTVFSITIAIAVGVFINILHTQKQVIALVSAQSNISIAIEQMAREIRTGNSFCSSPNANCGCSYDSLDNVYSCKSIDFYDANGDHINYSLSNDGFLQKIVNLQSSEQLTSNNVVIQYLNFYLLAGGSPETSFSLVSIPRITISMGVSPNNKALIGNVLNLETTVSQRQ